MGDYMSIRINGQTGIDAIKDGVVTESKIATGAVTNTKIGALAVDNGKIADSAINSNKIADGGISWIDLPSGSVLQVVQFSRPGTNTSQTSLLSLAAQTWTSFMSATITPKFLNSKILIMAHFTTYTSGASSNGRSRLLRDSTQISYIRYATYYNGNGIFEESIFNYLDSPQTTSLITYSIQGFWDNGAAIGFGYGDSGGSENAALTLMEIKG